MIEFEGWKNEIIDSILQLHEETKLIREHLEEEKEETENVLDDHEDQEEEEETENVLDDHEYQEEEETETEILILEKLDEINDSINILNTTVVESSIVISISIILALAFHYFINQISKW